MEEVGLEKGGGAGDFGRAIGDREEEKHRVYQFIADLTGLPVILHWYAPMLIFPSLLSLRRSTIGRIYKWEGYANGLLFISAVVVPLGSYEGDTKYEPGQKGVRTVH